MFVSPASCFVVVDDVVAVGVGVVVGLVVVVGVVGGGVELLMFLLLLLWLLLLLFVIVVVIVGRVCTAICWLFADSVLPVDCYSPCFCAVFVCWLAFLLMFACFLSCLWCSCVLLGLVCC